MITHATHLLMELISTAYKYTTNGKAQIWGNMAVKVSSPNISDTHVNASMVKICATWLGMVRRLVTNVPKPMPFNVSVRYCEGVWLGIWNVRPRAYNGHRSKSHKLLHRSLGVIGSRLCIVPLLGSSRMTRLIIIVSSLVGVKLLYREDRIGYKRRLTVD